MENLWVGELLDQYYAAKIITILTKLVGNNSKDKKNKQQELMINKNKKTKDNLLFTVGLRPHNYCNPNFFHNLSILYAYLFRRILASYLL